MTADAAKTTVVEIGKKLLKVNLTVRTWGNVSVRIDSDNFAITPSGYGYENIKPEDVVCLNLHKPDSFGDILPSSERLLHSEIYKKDISIHFIIHTHQKFASAVAGCLHSIKIKDEKIKKLLGEAVPAAQYAPAGTKELALNAALCVKDGHNGAVLMPHHGAVCFGKSEAETFYCAKGLETVCEDFLYEALPEFAQFVKNRFCGENQKNHKCLNFPVSKRGDKAGNSFNLYKKIYNAYPEINCIELSDFPAAFYAANLQKKSASVIPAFLEDFAQIAGANIFYAADFENCEDEILQMLKNRNAVLIKNCGALCCLSDAADMYALKEILEKNFLAFFLAEKYKNYTPLNLQQAEKMRNAYISDYAKRGIGY